MQFYVPFILRLVISFISLSLSFFSFSSNTCIFCLSWMPHIFKEVSSLWLVRILSPTWMLDTFQSIQFSSFQLLRRVRLFATPWTATRQGSLSITNSLILPTLMFGELVMPSNHFILCRPLLLLPSIFPSIRVFSNESALHIRWQKHWSFSFSISPSNEHPGLISFRIDWLDLLAVQGTLKHLLQHHSLEASIRLC